MKRATRERAEYERDCGKSPSFGRDILDSDAALRAEVRRLRSVIVCVRNGLEDSGWVGPKWAHEFITAALAPRKPARRKP